MGSRSVSVTGREPRRPKGLTGALALIVATATIAVGLGTAYAKPAKPIPGEPPPEPPKPLKSVKVPLPKDLDKFVKDKESAILLGKALFWTCRWGATARPPAPVATSTPVWTIARATPLLRAGRSSVARTRLSSQGLPLPSPGQPQQEGGPRQPVVFDTSEVVGSQGVVKKNFRAIIPFIPVDAGTHVADPVFQVNGANVRQVTGRNARR